MKFSFSFLVISVRVVNGLRLRAEDDSKYYDITESGSPRLPRLLPLNVRSTDDVSQNSSSAVDLPPVVLPDIMPVSVGMCTKGYNVLFRACRSGDVETVRQFLSGNRDTDVNTSWQKGKYYDSKNKYGDFEAGYTPLLLASEFGRVSVVKELLQHKNIDVNKTDIHLRTPLSMASRQGKKNVVRLLLARPEINVNIVNHGKHSPLHLAAMNPHLDIVKQLLERTDIEVNCQNHCGKSPLMMACQWGEKEIVESFLADPRVDLDLVDDNHRNASDFAKENDHWDILQMYYGERKSRLK